MSFWRLKHYNNKPASYAKKKFSLVKMIFLVRQNSILVQLFAYLVHLVMKFLFRQNAFLVNFSLTFRIFSHDIFLSTKTFRILSPTKCNLVRQTSIFRSTIYILSPKKCNLV
jgi:hypothetical protein